MQDCQHLNGHLFAEISGCAGHVKTTFAPKLESVLRMEARQALQPLMATVQFSSAASLFGAPGQGNYAAANAALEAHSAAASAAGHRQMAVQWGAWAAGTWMPPPGMHALYYSTDVSC